jgi:signal transduction histidine kinase
MKRPSLAELLPAGEVRESYERAFGHALAQLEYALERERQRIARELHDQIGQDLVLATMKLGALKASLPSKKIALVSEVQNLIREAIDEARSLACELYPQALHDLGLRAAVEWLVEKTAMKYGLTCVCDMASAPKELPREIEATIFQAVRELLINVAKHARAKEAKVVLRAEGHRTVVEIIDDGIGFDPTRVASLDPRRSGFGLVSLRQRLSHVGGGLSIDSAQGKGTKITLTLPLTVGGKASHDRPYSHQ